MFSRTCDERYYNDAVKIAKKINAPLPKINAWELNDAAFSFQRVRRYDIVNQNMDLLEHFQDNLNQNRSNLDNVHNFARVCATVANNFKQKFHDGEFDPPGDHDPREEQW